VTPDEAPAPPGGDEWLDRAAGILVSIETMKYRCASMIGTEFPLVFYRGMGRIVASDDASVALLVRGVRVDLTWDRLTVTWVRLLANHTLTVDELGGAADAVGIVSLFALIQADGLCTLEADGLIMLAETEGVPVHQYADMSLPTSWAPWRRKIHGD
jgi:hypothetical protein